MQIVTFPYSNINNLWAVSYILLLECKSMSTWLHLSILIQVYEHIFTFFYSNKNNLFASGYVILLEYKSMSTLSRLSFWVQVYENLVKFNIRTKIYGHLVTFNKLFEESVGTCSRDLEGTSRDLLAGPWSRRLRYLHGMKTLFVKHSAT